MFQVCNTLVEYIYVSKEDCTSSAVEMTRRSDESDLQRVVGTMKLHAVCAVRGSVSTILTRDLSCSCHMCMSDPASSPCGWTANQLSGTPAVEVVCKVPDVKIGTWVAAVYEAEWYLGEVIARSEDAFTVDFLVQSGLLRTDYRKPIRSDKLDISLDEILCVIDDPKQKRGYKISREIVTQIQSLMEVYDQ